jgi:hypothetical protein
MQLNSNQATYLSFSFRKQHLFETKTFKVWTPNFVNLGPNFGSLGSKPW